MPEVFVDHGYKTMAAGKIFHRGDKHFFQEYLATGGFGHDHKRRFHNRTDIRYGTGGFFHLMTI